MQCLFLTAGSDGIFKIEGDHIGRVLIHTVEVFEVEGVEHHVRAPASVAAGGFSFASEGFGNVFKAFKYHRSMIAKSCSRGIVDI